MSGSRSERTRSIRVFNIPDGITDKELTTHFERKSNGGSKLENVIMSPDGREAQLTFEDNEVAERVLGKTHRIEGRIVDVEKIEPRTSKKFISEDERTVLISNLPEEVTQSNLHIHFQKKKNAGGEIEEVKLSQNGQQALIVFEDPEVARAVIRKQQVFKGKVLKVENYKTPGKENENPQSSKKKRTVLVSDIPEGVSKATLHIHFQKKRNHGGEIEGIEVFPDDRKALVVFEERAVAEAVVKKGQVIEGKVVKVESYEQPEKEETTTKKTKTVMVSNIPGGTKENALFIHFQKKRNAGGEIINLRLSKNGEQALVIFEDPEVAQAVINKEQIFNGTLLKVEPFGGPQDPQMSKDTRTILISNIPEGATESALHIYFQKKRNAGGEIEEVKMSEDSREALVVFEDPEVLKAVINRDHVIQNKAIKVERYKYEHDPQRKEVKAQHTPEGARTVKVSGIPGGVTENAVHIHFQKKKNAGGDIEEVKLSKDGQQALLVFEKPEVANAVVNKEHIIKGKRVEVEIYQSRSELDKNQRNGVKARPRSIPGKPIGTEELTDFDKHPAKEKYHPNWQDMDVSEELQETFRNTRGTPKKEVINELPVAGEEPNETVRDMSLNPTQRTILISDIPDEVRESDVVIHFQKKSNGGGEVEMAKMFPEERKALVVFAEVEVADKVIEEKHILKGTHVNVEKYKPTQQKNEVYDVFTTVTATINPLLLHNIGPHDCKRILDETQEVAGVQWHHSAYGFLVTGSMFQVQKAGDFLQAKLDPSTAERDTQCFPPQNQKGAKWKTDDYQLKRDVYKDERSSQTSFPTDTDAEKSHLLDGNRASDYKQNLSNRGMASSRDHQEGNGEFRDSGKHRTTNFPLNPSATDISTWEEPTGGPHTWNDTSAQTYPQQPMERRTTWEESTGESHTQEEFSTQVSSQQPMEREAAPFTENVGPQNHRRDQIGTQNSHENGNQGSSESNPAGSIVNSSNAKTYSSTESIETFAQHAKKPFPTPRSARHQNTEGSKTNRSENSETAAFSNTGNIERRKNAANFASSPSSADRFSSNQNSSGQTEAGRHKAACPAIDRENSESQRTMFDKKDGQKLKEETLEEQDFQGKHFSGDPNEQDQAKQKETRMDSYDLQDPSEERLGHEKSQDPSIDMIQDSFEQMKLSEEPPSVSVAQFIHQVYHKDLEMFKSQNRVDVVLTEDKKRLTLKPMRGFEQSEMGEVERKLQQFYETTSRNLTTARMDLREFSPDDAEKIKKSMTRQRGRSDVMIEEQNPDVFTLIGNAENLELFQRNVMGVLRREVSFSESKEAMSNGPIVASRKGVRLVLMQGDIEKQECEAIVNFTDKDLVHKTGLPNTIKTAAGAEFWKECRDIIAKNGSLMINMVTTTTAGLLPCRLVVHAILPDLSKERRQEVLRHSTTETCRLALNKAKDQKLKSICFPVITPDIANLPAAVSPRLLCDVIKEFVDTNSPLNDNSVEEIRIVYRKISKYAEESVKEFTAKF